MTTKNSQDKLVDLAMKELAKVLEDLKQGKMPEMSNTMQKLASELETVSDKRKTMSEEEIKEFADKLVENISKED